LNPSITAFFPAFNDEETIAQMVTDALAVLSTLTDDYEVLVIDDGSTDGTAKVLDPLAGRLPRVRVIRHVDNRGYGAALASGFREARKDLVFYTDGDARRTRRTAAATSGTAGQSRSPQQAPGSSRIADIPTARAPSTSIE
jgi:glycosyltransferase involved in cell wall biosynthesis